MSSSASVWLVILVALVGANLPFISQRWFAVVPRKAVKTLGAHLLELLVLYVLVGAMALAVEQSGGDIYPKHWEFYVTTAALFLTFAFPGFVYRYLFRRRD